jgi:hypothetical protein
VLVAAIMEFLEPFTTRNNLMVRSNPQCGSRHGHVLQWLAMATASEPHTPSCCPPVCTRCLCQVNLSRAHLRDPMVLCVQRLLSQWKGKTASEYELAKGVLRERLSLGCTAGEGTVGTGGSTCANTCASIVTFDRALDTSQAVPI